MMEKKLAPPKEQAYSNISVRSFVMVAVLLLAILFFCGSLSYFVPQGAFQTDADSNIIQELTRYEDWSVSNENIAQLKIFPFWWDGYETENGWYSFRNYDLTNMPEGTKPFHQIKVYPVWNEDKGICSTGSVTVTGTASDGKASASYKINFVNMVNSLEIRTKDDKNLFPAEPETYWNPWNQWDPAEGAYVGGWHEGNVVRATAGETVKLIGVTNANAKNKKLAWYAECASCPDAVKISNGSLTIAKDLPGETLIWVCAQTCDNSYLETWIPVVAAPRATNVHLRADLGGMKYVSNSTRSWDVNTDGKVLNLSALVYPFVAAQDVTWTVNNKGIATISENEDGTATLNFTGTKFGKLVITATANDGSKEKTSFTLNVVNSVISLDLNSGLSVVGGKSLNLSKELTIDPAKPTNKKVTWTMLMKDADGNLVEVPKTVATLKREANGDYCQFYTTTEQYKSIPIPPTRQGVSPATVSRSAKTAKRQTLHTKSQTEPQTVRFAHET